jgi:hypothetical protein
MSLFTNFYLRRESQECGITFSETVEIVLSAIDNLDPYFPEQSEKLGRLAEVCLGEPMVMGQELTTQDKMKRRIKEMDLSCQRDIILELFKMIQPESEEIKIIG